MARENPEADHTPLPEGLYAAVLPVNGRSIPVRAIDPPPREPHSGACACEACRASQLADLAIRFY